MGGTNVTISNITISTWGVLANKGVTNDLRETVVSVSTPTAPANPATKAYVDAGLGAITPANWANYPAVNNLQMNGHLILNSGWSLTQTSGVGIISYGDVWASTNNMTLAHNGTPIITLSSGYSGLNVVGFTITGATNAVLLVNTNGVVSAPIIETTANLVLPNWQVVSATTSYPVQTNGSYSYSFAVSAGAFYRAVQLSGTNTVTINGTLIANGSSLTSLDLNPSLTATVAKAASAVQPTDTRYLATLTNGMASPTHFANTVSITGTTDAVQLSIRANGTQNSNVFEVCNSNGVPQVYATKTGSMFAGIISGTSIYSGNGYFIANQGAASFRALPFANASFSISAGSIGMMVFSGLQTNSSTSGLHIGEMIQPIYNQTSGTATNTDLLISRTETAIGSGPQKLIDAQVGGVSRFSVDNKGSVTLSSNLTVQGNTATKAIFATGASNTNVISGKENATQTEDSFAMYSSAGVKQLGYKSGSMTLAGTMTNTGAIINGNLTVTNLFYLSGTNSWLFSNGTNLFFRNVNNVTNAITAN
jgi:hypothetical protein